LIKKLRWKGKTDVPECIFPKDSIKGEGILEISFDSWGMAFSMSKIDNDMLKKLWKRWWRKVFNLKLQTIEGYPLTRDEFLIYLYDIIKMSSENKDFNHSVFFNDLRKKCEITIEEFTGIIGEVSIKNIEKSLINFPDSEKM
jgi:hypothetical protein